MTKVSIVILNYNYADFLGAAIDSALVQTYRDCEVVVVDDGSEDDSNDVIGSYGETITSVFQQNQGMMAASNAGFAASTGDIVMFLDADDRLHPDAMAQVVEVWTPSVAMVHWRLRTVDKDGNPIGLVPSRRYALANGDLKLHYLNSYSYVTIPTSGNAYAREVLERLFPLPNIELEGETGYRRKIPTDAYLKGLIPFEGDVVAIDQPLGDYRIHGANNGAKTCGLSNSSKRKRLIWLMNRDCPLHSKWADRLGVDWSPRNMVRDFYRYRVWSFANRLGEGEVQGLEYRLNRVLPDLVRGFGSNLGYGWLRAIWLAFTVKLIAFSPQFLLKHVIRFVLGVEGKAKRARK